MGNRDMRSTALYNAVTPYNQDLNPPYPIGRAGMGMHTFPPFAPEPEDEDDIPDTEPETRRGEHPAWPKFLIDRDGSLVVRLPDDASSELQEIVRNLLPEWLRLFSMKNYEYQDSMGSAFTLGPRGQFSDMYRKFMKLKRSMWDGSELTTESEHEIIMDLIGHCFLTLVMMERGVE